MAEIWFSSDWHLFHENMFKEFKIKCERCGGIGRDPRFELEKFSCPDCAGSGQVSARPFKSVPEMHETLVEAHNARVKGPDHYYNLGDVTMLRGGVGEKIMIRETKRFGGHKRLILGNHDHCRMEAYTEAGFEKIKGSHRIDNLLFTHFPLHPSSVPRGCVNVHGHIHTNPTPPGPYINISVEVINYAPITLYQLQEQAKRLLQEQESGG